MFTFIRNTTWKNDNVLWNKVAENYSDSPWAHINLGYVFLEEGLFDRAVERFKLAESLIPDNLKIPHYAQIYNGLGICFGAKGLYKEAIDYFKKALNLDAEYVRVYNNLGITYARIKQMHAAKNAWKKALKINPSYKQAQDNLKKLDKFDY
ncbi:MAG TPA: tetratricopeptide repeat protein [Candidatus Omnitrophica bacterium]|nr:tetratricopeptide repeat protein [Candidatus Omnitrophota bacterium]